MNVWLYGGDFAWNSSRAKGDMGFVISLEKNSTEGK